MIKSLKAENNFLANSGEQLKIIEHGLNDDFSLVPFQQKLESTNLFPLKTNTS